MIKSPSQIAIEAANRSAITVQYAHAPGHCAMCGYPHAAGESVVPFAPSDTFTDYQALKAPISKVICGWCAATWNMDFTQRALKSVMCSKGVFATVKNVDIAYFLTHPPEGAWIWVMGDQQRQHIVWRAVVNTSKDLFYIRLGDNNVAVRRKHLLDALDAAKRLAATASAGRKGAPIKSPFERLSRDFNEPRSGAIRNDLIVRSATDERVAADIKILQSSTPGELWGLTALLYESSDTLPKQLLLDERQPSTQTSTQTDFN